MYIQCSNRKLYSNRFLPELIDLIDKNKKFNESRTKFIEDAIIEKLSRVGVNFKVYTKEEMDQRAYEMSDFENN